MELREQVAEYQHQLWQNWIIYMLANLDSEHIVRWKREANTLYMNLSEDEKKSDRVIADKILALLSLPENMKKLAMWDDLVSALRGEVRL